MKRTTLYDLVAPAYGAVIPRLIGLTTARAVKRVTAGSPETLVELGIGTGRSFDDLKKRSPISVIAVDISQKMLRMARKKAKSAKLDATMVQGDVLDLPFRDGAFDAALSTFLVNLLPPRRVPEALTEMVRVVAPGGRLVVAHLEVTSPALRKAWHFADKVFADSWGVMRPLDMTDFYEDAGLRTVRNEEVQENFGTRVTTLVKVVG
jgi:ubiquinone/menaquinone biosynthesis C-methylase UbiE